MAKPDWGMLQQQFLAAHAESGTSPKGWCEDQGLNYATARRYIKRPAAQSAQKTAHKKLRTAHEKECAKEPICNSAIPTAQSSEQNNAHNDESAFNLRNYKLTDLQFRFVNEYLIDLNRTAAYKRAGGKCDGHNAYASASQIYRNIEVNRAIRDALAERERRTEITQDAVLKMWWDIATADVNELTEYRRLCCRHCWGFGFNYQWRDAVEYDDAAKKAMAASKPPPQDVGGYGYDDTLDPNPDCPRCNGTGTVDQKRLIVRMRYFNLTQSPTVTNINEFLKRFFWQADSKVFVLDPLDMTYLYYVFNFNPDERLRVLLENFDLMPRPSGVGVKYRIVTKKAFGHGQHRKNFLSSNFGA